MKITSSVKYSIRYCQLSRQSKFSAFRNLSYCISHSNHTMNTLVKSVLRLPAMRLFNASSVSVKNSLISREFSRNLFSTSGRSPMLTSQFGQVHTPSMNCMCGCNAKFVHTKGKCSGSGISGLPILTSKSHTFQANESWSSSWPRRSLLSARLDRPRRSPPTWRASR